MNWELGMTMYEIEKRAILSALKFFGGNKTKTAEALDIAVRTIDNKLEKYAQDDAAKKKN